jgi:hypothetical protein
MDIAAPEMEQVDSIYEAPASNATATIPVTFEWLRPATSVAVTGDFLGWGAGIPLQKTDSGSFRTTARLRPGTIHYKFIVDSEWELSPDMPIETDSSGNTNHVLRLIAADDGHRERLVGASGAPRRRSSVDGSAVAPIAFGGYIGDGVHREYTEEFGLEVGPAKKSGMSRSMSLADVGSIGQLQPRSRNTAKGSGVSRALAMQKTAAPAPLTIAVGDALPAIEFTATLDLSSLAAPHGGAATPSSVVSSTTIPAAHAATTGSAAGTPTAARLSRTGSGINLGTRVASAGSITSHAKAGPRVSAVHGGSAGAASASLTPSTTTMTTVQDSLRREGKLVLSMASVPVHALWRLSSAHNELVTFQWHLSPSNPLSFMLATHFRSDCLLGGKHSSQGQ